MCKVIKKRSKTKVQEQGNFKFFLCFSNFLFSKVFNYNAVKMMCLLILSSRLHQSYPFIPLVLLCLLPKNKNSMVIRIRKYTFDIMVLSNP